MPILWKKTICHHLQNFIKTLIAMILLLFVFKSGQIARFAITGSSGKELLFFAYTILPQILPLSLPIALIIATVLQVQQMSKNYEIVALRTSGFSWYRIFFPFLLTSIMISFCSFYVVGELAPKARRAQKQLMEKSSINPLLFLQKGSKIRHHQYFIDMELSLDGKSADHCILATQLGQKNLTLLYAKKALSSSSSIQLKDLLLFYQNHPEKISVDFAHQVNIPYASIYQLVKKPQAPLETSSYPLFHQIRHFDGSLPVLSDLIRRFSLMIAPISFTALGFFFSLYFSKKGSMLPLVFLIAFCLLSLTCFLIGKKYEYSPLLALIHYLAPHALILIACNLRCKQLSRG